MPQTPIAQELEAKLNAMMQQQGNGLTNADTTLASLARQIHIFGGASAHPGEACWHKDSMGGRVLGL